MSDNELLTLESTSDDGLLTACSMIGNESENPFLNGFIDLSKLQMGVTYEPEQPPPR